MLDFYFDYHLCLFFQGSTVNTNQIVNIHQLFENHPKFTCYVGPIRQTVEYFANNLLNLIQTYCRQNQVNVIDLFTAVDDENRMSISTITYEQFCDGLRKAKVPFPVAQIMNIMKYLVSFLFLCTQKVSTL
jgi:hypothetical protein